MASPVLVLLAGAGAAGWHWFCWLVLLVLVLLGCAAGCGLRSAGCGLAACTSKHTSTMSHIFFFKRGIVFWQSPIVFQQKPQKPHCHEMPFLNVDDHNFDPDSCAQFFAEAEILRVMTFDKGEREWKESLGEAYLLNCRPLWCLAMQGAQDF